MVDAVSRFSGFAEQYDTARPQPPSELVELLRRYSGCTSPVVVDLGAGTGLSSTPWQEHAGELLAIEPNEDMRAVAAERGLHVRKGSAEETGLPAQYADIVTASQALHWFDAQRALPEVARVLKPGGIFAAYDCDWPPTIDPEVDAAYVEFERITQEAQAQLKLSPPKAAKDEHLSRMRESGQFRLTKEICMHSTDFGGAERLLAVAESQGGTVALRDIGFDDARLGIAALAEVAERRLPEPVPWWWTYRVRIGVR